ncbi:MAG TPA: DUF29 domain-containing protein [Lamprocystis sp. (in: g-proteobacteria)]|nr:DUF29 domain-containing protein [Lamprocystis sp. (in: g-proteobacteria)]
MALAKKIPNPEPVAELYETDFSRWLFENARLLRQGRFCEADVVNIAEELEDMGRSEHRALGSHLAVVLLHLLKWQVQPTHRGSSWQLSIDNGRDSIEELLSESPSLRTSVPALIEDKYRIARRNAATETKLPASAFPDHCPYTLAQVLGHGYLPDA